MIKKILILPILFSLLILSGCTELSGTSAGKIIPPQREESPLGGKWTVVRALGEKEDAQESDHQLAGIHIQFAPEAMAFDGKVWGNLSYKVKRVNTADYLTTKYFSPADDFALESEKVDVITIYDTTNFLGEAMFIDKTSMILFAQDKTLLLNKVSDETDSILGLSDEGALNPDEDKNEGSAGVLLGLRIPEETGYRYQTLWVAVSKEELHPLLVGEQLFFPRTSGFWELRVENFVENQGASNILTARPVSPRALEKAGVEDGAMLQGSTDKKERVIHYVGNDYVAVEKKVDGLNQLQVLPVDNLASDTVVKVSDLLGNEGLSAYLRARENALSALENRRNIVAVNKDDLGENFGLLRRNGHWLLNGRINHWDGWGFEEEDFDLNIVPPVNLIFYDTLTLSWHHIKNRVPDAMDAFTSPGKEIALVKTKTRLSIYTIGAEKLSENPLAEVELREGTTVVMAEWATSSYVDSWERTFRTYGGQPLSNTRIREN